jgi:Protein of unknown function (DUF2778)
MPKTTATYCDVPHFDGRVFSFDDSRRLIRLIGDHVVMGLGAVAAVGVLVTTVTFAAAWIVNTVVATNPLIHANALAGPGALVLVQDAPNFANAPAVTFADRWPRTTASMQASVMPLIPPHPLEIADNVPVPPKPERATSVPLPRPHPAQHDIVLAPVGQIGPPVATATPPPAPPADKRAAPQEAHNKPLSMPAPDSRTAVYDIAAHTVYLPNGDRLEAHSGLGDKLDDPRYVHVRMRGPTPPNVYELALREEPFHGVRAIRLNPVDDGKMFGRDGMLAHTYMLGANGQSNGCVSFRDYRKFLSAFLNGEVDRLVVVANLGTKPSHIARPRHGRDYRYASND